MNKVLVVINFNAGRKKAILYKKKLQKFLLKNAQEFKFITIDELSEIDITCFDTIIAMGGDGTITKTLPYVMKNNLRMGIIPCGTANLLSYRLKIPNNIDKAINLLKTGTETLVDTIKINNQICILRFGTGYDANIICKTPQSLKNKFGYFAYFVAGILFALRLKKKEYHLIYDEKELKINASCIIISNAANMYKNLFNAGKNSTTYDGFFDVFILKTINPIILFFEILKIGLNIYINSNSAQYFKAKKLEIKNEIYNSHIDGEKHVFQTDICFEILPSRVKVIN